MHKAWGTMKKVISKDANFSKMKLYLQVNGKSTTDSDKFVNSFNDLFVTIESELAKNIVSTTNPMSYVDSCNNSIVIPPVTMAEVRNTILLLKNSSAGWEDFSHL